MREHNSNGTDASAGLVDPLITRSELEKLNDRVGSVIRNLEKIAGWDLEEDEIPKKLVYRPLADMCDIETFLENKLKKSTHSPTNG